MCNRGGLAKEVASESGRRRAHSAYSGSPPSQTNDKTKKQQQNERSSLLSVALRRNKHPSFWAVNYCKGSLDARRSWWCLSFSGSSDSFFDPGHCLGGLLKNAYCNN